MVITMKQRQAKDERGMVAIMIAMFLMIILSLITLGFLRLMQREQRQALDNSLSTQAYYAAESGINDAVKAARANPAYAKGTCGPDATLTAGVTQIGNANLEPLGQGNISVRDHRDTKAILHSRPNRPGLPAPPAKGRKRRHLKRHSWSR